MLGKLIKYEFKACSRYFLPIYIAILAIFTLNGFTLQNFGNEDNNIFSVIMFVLLISIISIFIFLSLYVTVKRFANSIFGSEGYLTNTLPVKPTEIVFSKAFTMLLYSIISVVVFIIASFLLILPNLSTFSMLRIENVFKEAVSTLAQSDFNITIFTIQMVVSGILSSLFSIFSLYLAVSVAHMKQCINHKYIYGFVTYFAFTIVTNGVFNLIFKIFTSKSDYVMSIGTYNLNGLQILNQSYHFINNILFISDILTIIVFLITALVVNYLIAEHLNVE